VENFYNRSENNYDKITKIFLAVPKRLMTDLASELTVTQTATLLTRYGFELKGYTPLELIEQWLRLYPAKWVRLAVIEALYQGRYKAISVEHILSLWLRRGQPTFHFTYDFERLIFRVLPQLVQEQFSSSNASSVTPIYAGEEVSSLFESGSSSYCLAGDVEESERLSNDFQEDLQTSPQIRLVDEVQSNAELNHSIVLSHADSSIQNYSRNKEHPLSEVKIKPKPSGSFGQPIHEFTPAIDPSDFYSKLKAVVEQDLQEDIEAYSKLTKRDELG
jgi:hypothetical protein